MTEDTATNVTAGILGNDTDPDGDTLTVTGVSNATGGSVVLQAGVVTFTPDANLCGAATASFDYDISDGHGGSDTGHATVNITCVNDAPHAVNDSASGTEDTDLVVAGANLVSNDTDTEGDSLSVTAVSNATGGSAVLGAGDVTFTPDANLCGNNVAGFNYTVSDGNGGTDTGHVTIDLSCDPDAPVANDDTVTVDEDSSNTDVTSDLLANDTDGDGDTLTITNVDNATGGSADLTAGNVTFTPDADACGDGYGSFDYTVDDGNGGSDTAHATVDVTCENDNPVATDDAASGTEDTDVVIPSGDLTANDSDVDGDALSVSAVSNPTGGTVDLTGGVVTFTPDADLCGDGAAGFDYTVDDGNGGTDTGHVTIDLECVNDAPVAVDDSVSGTEDTDVVVTDGDLAGQRHGHRGRRAERQRRLQPDGRHGRPDRWRRHLHARCGPVRRRRGRLRLHGRRRQRRHRHGPRDHRPRVRRRRSGGDRRLGLRDRGHGPRDRRRRPPGQRHRHRGRHPHPHRRLRRHRRQRLARRRHDHLHAR